MSVVNYQVYVRDPVGILVDIFRADKLVSVSYGLRENEPGVLELVLPASSIDQTKLERDGQIEIYRSYQNSLFLEGETTWFIKKVSNSVDEKGLNTIYILAYSACELLKRRIIAYPAGSVKAEKTAPWDDMMKAIVRENYGASATDTTRDISAYLSVQVDTTLGVSITRSLAWRNILAALQDISAQARTLGDYNVFDVIRLDTSLFQFKIFNDYRNNDHTRDSTSPVIITQEQHNLDSPSLLYDWSEERNYIYGLGQGQESERIVVEVQDAVQVAKSPFNRNEFACDARQSETVGSVTSEAYSALEENKPKRIFTGKILQTPACIYGVHWIWGDLVTAEYQGLSFDCHVETVTVNLNRDGVEVIQGYLRSITDVG
jgi:hypothetical protein